jgi:hypothetical protein
MVHELITSFIDTAIELEEMKAEVHVHVKKLTEVRKIKNVIAVSMDNFEILIGYQDPSLRTFRELVGRITALTTDMTNDIIRMSATVTRHTHILNAFSTKLEDV